MKITKIISINDLSWIKTLSFGAIHVLASRPELDKTYMAIEFLKLLAPLVQNKKSIYFSIELLKETIEDRLGSAGDRTLIWDKPGITPYDIVDQIKEIGEGSVDWIIIDYFQLMKNRQGEVPIKNKEVTVTIFEDLNLIAENQQVKFLILYQLPRSFSPIHQGTEEATIEHLIHHESFIPCHMISSLCLLINAN